MGRHGLGIVLLGVLLVTRSVCALSLQDIITTAKRSVVHLSILDAGGEELATGTGFVISPDGKLATNYHVVEDATRAIATFDDGRKVEVLGARAFDAQADLAILQLAPGHYDHLPIAGAPARQGDEVVVVGSPRGFAGSVSTGIVSAIRAEGTIREGHDDGERSWMLQISAPISSGSSGSPILNHEGQVIGVAVGTYEGQALNFGVPAAALVAIQKRGATAQTFALSLVRSGRSVRDNLLISAGVLGAVGVIVLGLAARDRRRRRLRAEGRALVDRALRR
jgi:S1-C subfamily serine protease